MVRLPSLHDQRGFTIVEVMVAASLLLIGVLGVLSLVDGANARTTTSRSREAGLNLARELVEGARLVPYSQAGQDTIVGRLQAGDGLADSSGATGYQVRRRGVTYTVATESCLMDDPNDGVGTHDATWCANSPAAGSDDDNPKDYRRVTFTVSWNDQGRAREVRQATTLTPRGTADLPKITALDVTTPPSYSGTANQPVITSNVTSVPFRAQTSISAAGISWLVDGSPKAVTSNVAGASTWTWNWNIGTPGAAGAVVDGTYQVSAQPFDASGAAGISDTKTVKLNRSVPGAPSPVYAGWSDPPSGAVSLRDVDVEWIASRERDVVGYRVYEQESNLSTANRGPITRRCPSTTSTDLYTTKVTCSFSRPAATGSGLNEVNYWVVAIDKAGDTELLREGTSSPEIGIFTSPAVKDNRRPQAIQSVTVTPGTGAAAGTTSVSWPIVADPDTVTPSICGTPAGSSDCVLMYRIYRDGVRYGSTPYETPRPAGATRNFIDVAPGSTTHCYLVEAIDTHMREGGSKTTCG